MGPAPGSDITRILSDIEQGHIEAVNELLPLLYGELRRMAAVKMAGEAPGHTLQPTALVHEAWLSLVDSQHQSWQNRAHFFGAATEAMRRILIDRARRKQPERRGAGALHVDIHECEVASPASDDRLLELNEALERSAAREPQKAELVKLRYFVGLKIEEAADVLGISQATAKRWWTYARACLFNEINAPPSWYRRARSLASRQWCPSVVKAPVGAGRTACDCPRRAACRRSAPRSRWRPAGIRHPRGVETRTRIHSHKGSRSAGPERPSR
jgi:RNA polymerase sigma factor (TIGR02999 family)